MWLIFCSTPEVTGLVHFCPKIKGQRVCVFFEGVALEGEDATPGSLPSPTRQRNVGPHDVNAVTVS